jgi:hypothetical protein
MMAELKTVEVKNAVIKTIQHRIEEINRELAEIAKNLEYFERKHGLKTDKFYQKFLKGEMGDDMDLFEWKASKEIYDELRKQKDLLLEAIG